MTHDVYTIATRFGDFEVSNRDVLTFHQGLPGFEECRRFVLFSHEAFAPLRCLHAIEGGEATFLAMDPHHIVPDYADTVRPDARIQVQADPDTPLVWLALLTFSGDNAPTANLRAPIIINPVSMLGCQVLLDDERYTAQHTLVA